MTPGPSPTSPSGRLPVDCEFAGGLAVIGLFGLVPFTAGGPNGGVAVGLALVGCAASHLYWHPYRLVGAAGYMLSAAFLFLIVGNVIEEGRQWCFDIAAGFLFAGVAATERGYARFVGKPVFRGWPGARFTLFAVAVGAYAVVRLGLIGFPFDLRDRPLLPVVAAVVVGGSAVFCWVQLFRPAVELLTEPPLWVMYNIRAVGPGLAQVPARGPCLVIANHGCWFDPLFLAKVFPRPVTPMMTSRFYDLPVMRWLMRRVFRTIRVPDQVIKQDAPEIREAVAALDRGECVVIFPEGYLRRSEEKPLKRFGRGVWQILTARPETPVFTCWIEGGWGSYCSYFDGKPTKNKKPDRRRRIGIGVPAPVTVDPVTLEHHLRTRLFLMNRVAEARKLLGLPDLPLYELPGRAEGKEDEEE
ncbi:MAG: 2-acyl-glycerophospho-ethanolamine acyltransferase [Gemmataceae bacterium]|nr:2-acyl-glycerophospho-ethanolamine acyltransferase [Gemmataceae bacterium]